MAISHLMQRGILTKAQRRRFSLYIIQEMPIREIARLEGTSHVAILKSIQQALKKLI
ncbi:hypothetical protein SDC9_84565 [bioreactor metagenome]|uniref:Uncharacterized protein n=1 Tax=bioreactor metagenome TaxID=1076179 RepID=A0A644ZGX9_9ZZZZ